MIDPSDTPEDDAWDDVPKMDDDKPKRAEANSADTVPPPASGDAYSADTVIRDVPREALEAIREKQRVERLAGKSRSEDLPKISRDESPSAQTRAALPAPEMVAESAKRTSEPAVVLASDPAADSASGSASGSKRAASQTKPLAEKTRPIAASAPTKERYAGPEPVTSSELLIAVAGAVIAVVAGFYLISSAF